MINPFSYSEAFSRNIGFGYYGDFAGLPVLAKVLRETFLHDGTSSSFRDRAHGRPVPPGVPGHRFVAYLQNHDQVGNRATGDRISSTLSDPVLQVGAALLLTSPFTPMLWMGEEWGARTPWCFFSDHDGELGEAVRQGRRAEFSSHGWADPEAPGGSEVPDPQARSTLEGSQLDWDEPLQERHARLLAWTRDLIALRRARPELSDGRRDRVAVTHGEDWLVVRRGGVAVACNLSATAQDVPLPGAPGQVLLTSDAGVALAPGAATLTGYAVVLVELAV